MRSHASCALVVASAMLTTPALAAALVVNADNSPYLIGVDDTYDDVTVASGGVLVVNAPLHVLGDMMVLSGGLVTHDAGDIDAELDVGGTLLVALGGSIDVDGKGLARVQHWDPVAASVVATPYKAGGSHGGAGASTSMTVYGDAKAPVLLGSGGGNGDYGRTGGAGGGRIVISSADLVLDGLLSADGGAPSTTECDHGGGGGSGGSVFISTGSLSGVGSISATGATARRGGGGGRVAISHTGSTFSGTISAAGGGSPCGYPGGLGSTHSETNDGHLSLGIGYVELTSSDSYASLTLSSGSVLRVLAAATVLAPVNVVASSRVELSSSSAFTNLELVPTIAGTVVVNAPLTWVADLTVPGVMELNQHLSVTGTVTVPSGGLVTHTRESGVSRLSASGTIDFQLGSFFSVDGRGWGSARHWDPVGAVVVGSPYKMGGSHGGRGADGASLVTYGNDQAPVLLGSGGGNGDYGRTGGAGGGRIWIEAPTLIVDGVLSADGSAASTTECDHGGGGGAGGSVLLTVDALEGAGSIRARGGTASRGGGGGRIAVFHTTSSYAGTFTASAGTSPCGRAGAPGSTHIEGPNDDVNVGTGTLEIDAGDSYSSITLSGGSVLHIRGAASVTSPITVVSGARVDVLSQSAFDNLSLVPAFDGTVAVHTPLAWPADVTVRGVLELNEHLNVSGDVTIPSGGLVTHASGAAAGRLEASGTVDFNSGSSFNVAGKGYGIAQHWDPVTAAVVTTSYKMGGSYGGRGADIGNSRAPYGSATDPVMRGSGGGNGDYGRTGGAGGGRILIAAPTLIVNGILNADGSGASTTECDHGGGGGSGGSVLLNVGSLQGTSGSIRARGGTASRGGGGGRVAAFFTSNTFSGALSSAGGTSPCGRPGEPGSTHFEGPENDVAVGTGTLDIGTGDSFSAITLSAGSVLRVSGSATVTEPITIVSGARVELRNEQSLDNLVLNPSVSGTLAVYAPVTWSDDVTVPGVLELNQRLLVQGNVVIPSGGLVTHATGASLGGLEATGTVDLRLGSFFNVDGRGLGVAQHWDPVTASVVTTSYKMGGSHGGRGSDGNSRATYGEALAPSTLGSGGGNGDYGRTGGSGGGVVRITAATLIANGVITAGGGGPSTLECDHGGGGGSGGSIWLDVGTLTGDGVIRANGGRASRGGGGGRLFVAVNTWSFDGGVFSDAGTSPCSRPGSEGTLVVHDEDDDALSVRSGIVALDEAHAFASLAVSDGAVVLDGAAAIASPITVAAEGTLLLTAADALSEVGGLDIAGRLEVLAPVLMAGSAVITGTAVVDDLLAVDALTVSPGGVVEHSAGVRTLSLDVNGTLTVASSGRIDADGLGLRGAPAAGFGTSGASYHPDTFAIVAGSGAQNGGSHAALGGAADGAVAVAPGYDNPEEPRFGGGGGGQGSAGEAGGAGGGVIRINATSLVLDGLITADGLAGAGVANGGGGGAGGSVIIDVGALSGGGVGRISVDGGASSAGGGAGGLLWLRVSDDSGFAGSVTSAGGAGTSAGGDGESSTTVDAVAPQITSSAPDTASLGQEYTYQAVAVGTQPIAWSVVTGPPGAAIDAASGLFTWTPSASGLATVRIAAANGVGSGEQSFVITVVVAPTITSTPSGVAYVGQPYHYNTADSASATGTAPLSWSASLAPSGFSIDADTGRITWIPSAQGSFGACIDVTNAVGVAQQCWQIEVTTDGGIAPSITSTPTLVAVTGQPYAYDEDTTVEASGSSPLSYAALVAPPGLTIDENTGLVAWSPEAVGAYGVCLEVQNPFGSDVQCFTVVVAAPAGAAPAITSTPSPYAVLGSAYAYDDDNLPEASGSAPLTWGLGLAPAGVTIDATTGAITWTPAAGGVNTLCLVVANPAGTDQQCFSVEVLADPGPPQFISTPTLLTPVDEPYLYDDDARAEAIGPGAISYEKSAGPEGLSIDAATGAVTFTPDAPGNFDVVLAAQSAFGSDEQAFTLTVVSADEAAPPVIVHDANLLGAVGSPYVYNKDQRITAVGAAPLSYGKASGPPGLNVDASTGLVSFVPTAAGNVSVAVTAENAFGSDRYDFTIVVAEAALGEPTARFTATPESGDAPLVVAFDASGSSGSEGAPLVSHLWRFGPGEPAATGVLLGHTYQTPGSRVARLSVQNVFGVESSASRIIRVQDEGAVPPSARILISEVQGSDSLSVSFACECGVGDSPMASYRWDLGDGTVVDAPALSHVFGPGGYTVTLTVVDEAGLTATDQVFISVSAEGNRPPLLQAGATPTGGPAPLEIRLSALAADPDGELAGLLWTFPDGSTSEDESPQYTFDTAGVYEVQVEAVDDLGLASTASVEIEVTDDGARAPEILSVAADRATVGVAYSYDDDGRPAVRGSRPLRFRLGKLVGAETQGAPEGMTVDEDTGVLAWTPAAGQGGEHKVVLVVENDAGSALAEWTLTVSGDVVEPPAVSPEGCGCEAASTTTTPSSPALFIAALVAALLLRRRRRARLAGG